MVKDHSDRREKTHCCHIGYSFRLATRVLLYASSHRQDNTSHSLCYTSHGALAGTRNSSLGPPHEGSIRWPIAPWANSLTTELHLAPLVKEVRKCGFFKTTVADVLCLPLCLANAGSNSEILHLFTATSSALPIQNVKLICKKYLLPYYLLFIICSQLML